MREKPLAVRVHRVANDPRCNVEVAGQSFDVCLMRFPVMAQVDLVGVVCIAFRVIHGSMNGFEDWARQEIEKRYLLS